jgi:alanyl aminopeptidase
MDRRRTRWMRGGGRAASLRAILCIACAIAACRVSEKLGGAIAGTFTPSRVAEPLDPPRLRLPRSVVPEANRVRLDLDPTRDTFRGRIEIAARALEPVRVLWLNADHLHVQRAAVRVKGRSVPLEVLEQGRDFVGLRAARPLPEGPLQIEIEYAGEVAATETQGIFRQKQGGDWYAFSQFEPTYARRAFPCFDEPDRKVPWQLTLEVPEGLTALSNTSAVSEQETGHGTKVVTFRETPPLPSYLVAFAAGPFEVVQGPSSRSGTPFRIAVARGRGSDAEYALETAPQLLARLEDYFGIAYPFEKLDLLAIPLTVSFGAMEHPGLLTFNEGILTARPADLTIAFQRRCADTLAHELAHQWFGDLVTLAWWDDVWLNEAFASWMGARVLAAWKPEWDHGVGAVQRRSGAMGADSLQSARRVRQPIESNDDIANAFDGITYSKGASVIEMFERWVGRDVFQRGVREYLRAHAFANATARDFLSAIGSVSGVDVATPFSSFLDQPGAPLVRFELRCGAGPGPRLVLEQERYRPSGSKAAADGLWQVPICARYAARGGSATDCTLLAQKQGVLPLTRALGCPAWVLPNEGETGYYRSAFRGDLLERLVDRGMPVLSLPERVGVVGDVNALVTAGQMDVGKALALVPRYAADPEREIVSAMTGIANSVRDVVPETLRPRYARFVRTVFGARARKLGWTPGPGEDEDTMILRSTLLRVETDPGEDRELAAGARPLALRWIEDHTAVDGNLVDVVLRAAARYGDRDLFERFYTAAKQSADRRDRRRFLGALSDFRDPELLKRDRELATSGEFDVRESSDLLLAGLGDPETRRSVYEAIKAEYDSIEPRLPKDTALGLVSAGTAQCDASLRADVEAFFRERTSRLPGGPRRFAQAMEGMDLCIAWRARQRAAVSAFLRAY